MPRPQDFLTVGHLYRGIEQGLDGLASQRGEQVLFVGEPRAQATPERFRYPQLIAVTDLASAHAAIDEVIEQGEGARGDWRPAHYGQFFRIWNEYQKLREQDPSFEPARPVMPAFTQQPYDLDQPQPQPTEPLTREVAELFNLGYEVLLHVLTRFFTHTDETDEQLDALVGAAFGIMTGVLKPLGTALTRLPFGPGSPDHTAGAAFQMYYQIGNFVPWRDAAWVLLSERAAILSQQCAETARHVGVPDAVSSAAAAAGSRGRSPGTCRITCGPPEATGSPSPVRPRSVWALADRTQPAYWSSTSRPRQRGRLDQAVGEVRERLTAPASPPPARSITASWASSPAIPQGVVRPSCSLMRRMAGGLIGTGRQSRLRGRSCRGGEERDVPGWGRRSSSRSSCGAGGRPGGIRVGPLVLVGAPAPGEQGARRHDPLQP
jgi:hypothetical protein